MKKIFYLLLFFFSFLIFSPLKVFADNNFSTDYFITYAINENASTHVSIDASLTNLTTNYYASSYSINLGFLDVQNINIYDSEGKISPKITKTTTGTDLQITFNKKVVGYGLKQKFNLSFDTSEVAKDYNSVWDVNIPGIANQEDFSSFNVDVIYPSFLGSPAYIKPSPSNLRLQNDNKLSFNKQDLGSSGISVSFGNYQIYDFNLTYHLKNKNYFPITTEIALPPTTNYQDVKIESISHKPINVKLDKDNNWLAQFKLSPYQKMDIQVKGKAKIYLNPRIEELTSSQLALYLKPQSYWEVNNQKIKELANTLKTPYAIYQYIVKTLKYDFGRVENGSPRLGALQTLNNPDSAVCLEFTDLFIALARAAGIPSRQVEGYGYSSNTKERPLSLIEDVLHAWPEYYDFDKKTWVMVDPTWGNTTNGVDYFNTLDFDHFAFVIKGETSNYPIPAGGYKLVDEKNTKDVNIKIGDIFNAESSNFNVLISLPDTLVAALPISGKVKIINNGSELIKNQTISLSSRFLKTQNKNFTIKNIPPLGYIEIPISFEPASFLTNTTDTIKITAGNKTFYKNVRILPFFVTKEFLIGGLVFVSTFIILSITAIILRRISFFRQKKEDNLRGESQEPQK